jgi:RND family efflux transporter MFP subunit
LDNLENAIRAAENQLSQAQIGYENSILSLSNAKKSKDQQLILSQTTLDNAKGQLNLINTQISDLTITAPIRGEITNKSVEIGTQVRIGQKVAQISQIDMVKIIIQLPFEDVAKLMLGETVRLNKNFEGKISYINPSADAISKKQEVEIIFDNKDRQLVPETFVSVEIPTKKIALEDKQAYYLPLKSVITAQNGNFIFIVKDGRAVKTAVELIGVEGEAALIKTDLSKDTPVAVEGNKMLEDGDEVVETTNSN